MDRRWIGRFALLAMTAISAAGLLAWARSAPRTGGATWTYEELVALHNEWREFQRPKLRDGAPDYGVAAMREQRAGLEGFRRRLEAFDVRDWPVSRQIDQRLMRAEMNGMEFDHRVLRPWARDPGFYIVFDPFEPDVPAREGPQMDGALETWRMTFPLAGRELEEFRSRIRAVPRVLEEARKNLVEETPDLWTVGIRAQRQQAEMLRRMAPRLVAASHAELLPDIERAAKAVDEFRAWLEKGKAGMKDAPSGIGVADFDWAMRNVHLVPYTWRQQLDLLQEELDRSLANLALERHRNRGLPPLEPARDRAELKRRFDDAFATFMAFLRDKEIFTVPAYMKLDPFEGGYADPTHWDFFTQVDYRDPLPMRSHMFHWLEKQRLAREPHASPMRSGPLLYNIWAFRSEGLATGLEEWLMHAGLLEGRPRSRELVWILVAMRAVRAMTDLKMHSNELRLDGALRFAVEGTPEGWLRAGGDTVWTDVGIYIRQPGYGTSYIVGKAQINRLLADAEARAGAGFRLREFMDGFFASGVIPVSLIRWETLGLDDGAGLPAR